MRVPRARPDRATAPPRDAAINPAATEPGRVGEAALSAGLEAILALPVMADGAVTEVVALYF